MGIPTEADLKSPSLYEEMDFIANTCYTPHKDRHYILELPIVKTLVWLKWQSVRYTFWTVRFFQVSTNLGHCPFIFFNLIKTSIINTYKVTCVDWKYIQYNCISTFYIYMQNINRSITYFVEKFFERGTLFYVTICWFCA